MRRAFSNPVGKASRLAALAAEPATLTRPVRRPARLLSLVVLAAVLLLWAGTALAQTIEISPTTAQTLREGEALKVTLTVNGLATGQEASIDFPATDRTASLDDFEVYQQATEPSGTDNPLTLTTFTESAGVYAYYTFATGSDPAGPVTFWVVAKTDTVFLDPDLSLPIKGLIVVPDPFDNIAETGELTVTLTDATPIPAPTGKPTTPANLTAAAGKGAVTLTWDAVDATSSNTNVVNDLNITKHQVRQSTDGGTNYGTWTDIPNSAYGEVNANTYTIGSLMDGTEYTFQVRAVNACTATTGCGNSDAATATMATPDADALAAPTGLMATAGNTQITLTWTDPGDAAIEYYEYQQKEGVAAFGDWTEIPGSSATTTSYRLTGLDNGTTYGYRIRARTSVKSGTASDAVTATPRGFSPAAPVLTVTPRNGGVTLSWPNPVDASLQRWEYQYKVGAGVYQPWQVVRVRTEEDCDVASPSGLCLPPYLDTSGATLQFAVGGLTNGTPHTFRMRAVNADGSATSNEVTTTPVAGVPAKPTGLTTRLDRDGDRLLEWDQVEDPSILRYEFTTDEGRTWSTLASSAFLPDEFRSGYTFRIRAVNAAGPGPASEPAVEEEAEERVVTQAYVRSASLEWDSSTRKATLVWDQTEHANFRWWTIRFSARVHRSTWRDWSTELPIGTTRYEIPATFNGGATIVVWIIGCVSKGCGPSSLSTSAELRFEAGAPNTVLTGFSATPDDASITLAWDAPTDSGITHFEYEVSSASGHTDIPDGDDADTNAGDETSHTVTTINGAAPVNGELYDFRLRAANANGGGPWTEWIRDVMPLAAGVPAAPTGVVQLLSGDPRAGGHDHAHGSSTPGLTFWDDPHDPSIIAYQVLTNDGWVDIPDATTTGANRGANPLRARNANGWGPSVRATTVHSPAPAQPTGLQAAPGNSRVTLTWDDAGKDVYIEFYRYTADGGETWTEIPGSQSTVQGQFTRYTVPNLTNGQAYTFAIQAENDTGASPVSAAVTATPRGGAPAKPTGLSAAPRAAEVRLTWDNPRDTSITKYQVKQDDAAWANISGSDASTTSHTVGTLTNGTAYRFQVRAVNDHNGDNTDDPGPASDAVTVTPGLPTAPASLSVAPGDAQAILTWTLPASDGGSAVTGYEYTSNADAATPTWTDVPDGSDSGNDRADETEYTVSSLDNNTTYAFAVRAENANGQGAATPTLRATPVPRGTPQRPVGLTADPIHEQVRLTWTLPNFQHPVTSYQYRQSTDGGTAWSPDWTAISGSDATTTEHLLTGLANDTTYTFELRALKDSTVGPSARVQATPSQAAARQMIDRQSSGRLTTPTGGTYTVTQLSPPAGLNWRIAVPGATEIDGRTFTLRSLQGTTPETSPRYTFTSTGQEGLDILVQPPLASQVQVCLEPTSLLGREAGSQPVLVLRYNGTSWTPLPTTTDGGMVCGTTSAFSAFVLGYEAAAPQGGAPAEPTGLSAAPGNAEVTLTWDNPGDASITKYLVKQDAAAWAEISGSDAGTTSHTVGGLNNGTAYTFRIRAVNDHNGDDTDDPGPASDAVTVTPGVPAAPASLVAAEGDTQVTLTWTAPASNNGSPVTGYEYTSTADAATPDWRDVPDSGSDGRADETEYTVTGLVNNDTYAFAVRAENANGQGVATPTLRATPLHPDAPQRPAGLKATPNRERVKLTWARPNVHRPVTSYQYRQSTDGGTTWSPDWTAISGSGAATTEHLLTGLTNGRTYTFELRALKGSTEGPSAQVQATPSGDEAEINRESSGQLTTRAGDTYTVTQIPPPPGLNWRIIVPGTTEIAGRTFTVRSLQGTTPETSPRYTFTSTGQEGLDIQVSPPLAGEVQVCLEPTPLLRREAGSRPLLVLRYSGTAWTALPTTTGGGMVCGRTSAFSAFVLGYEVAGPGRRETPPGTNAAPEAAQPLPTQTVRAGETSEPLDLTLYFDDPDDDTLTFEAESDDADVVIADLPRGSNRLTLRGVAAGEAVVVVTARDPYGEEVSRPLTVTVRAVAAPETAQSLPPQTLLVGETSEPLDLTPYFDDPDGDPLTYTAVSYDEAVLVAEVAEGGSQLTLRAVAAGEAVVIVTARDPDGAETILPMRVTVRTVGAPEAAQPLPPQTVRAGETSEPLDLTPYFDDPDGDPLTFTAVSDDAGVVIADLPRGSNRLILRGVAAGEAVVVVTARDPDGAEVSQPLTVTVRAVAAPEAAQSLPPQTLLVGETSEPLDLTPYFDDPDGDPLTFAAVSDDAGIAIADLPRGSNWLVLRGVAAGEAVVVVTARDPGGAEASQSMTVTVRTVAAPEAAQSLPPQTLLVGETSEPLDLTPYFRDPDGDPLTFTAVSYDDAVLVAEVAEGGSQLTLRAVAAGEAVVIVTARDPDGTETILPMTVTVRANAAPEVAEPLPTQTVTVGETSEPLDLTPYFHDPDGDPLTYAAVWVSDASVAIAEVPEGGSQLILRGVGAGEARVLVTARDPYDEKARQSLRVTVRTNTAPEAAQPLPTQTVLVDTTSEPLDLTPYFDDPDGDPLTYAAVSDNAGVAVAEVAEGGSQLTLRAVGAGEAVVVVTARDPYGEKARQSLRVTVRTNTAPEAAQPLPTQTVLVDTTSEPLDLTPYFDDPDGDPLTYAAVSDNAGVAVAEVAEGGSQLTLRGVGAGEALVVVTARDPYGEKARQSLTVTVRTNAAPKTAQSLPPRTMLVDTTSEPLDLTPYFHDPDGDPLTFAAVSYDDAVLVAEVAEGGSQLTLRAVAVGEAVVVVTARDPFDAEASQPMTLTVRTNAAPEAAQPLPAQTVLADTTSEPLDLTPYFHDPDGDPLTYAAVSDDASVAVAEVAEGGSQLTLRGVAVGEAVVVVTARDLFDAEASQPLTLTVRTNAAPEVAQPLPTRTMLVDTTSEPLDLTPYFHDPDGDPLTYAAVSDNASVAVAELAEGGSELTLRAVGAGEAVVVVTARDPFDAEASQPLTLTVRTNAAPEAAQPLPAQTVLAGAASEPLDLTPYFHDPDGDPLTYAAVSANAAVATAGVAGDLLTLTGVAAGAAAVTVTARDPHGGEASQTVIVTVTAVHADWVKAWAARFGRTVTGHVLDGVQERLRVAPRPGFQATLGGHQLGGISEEASRELGDWQLGGPAAFQRELELLAAGRTDGQTSNGAPQQASSQQASTARDLFTSSAFSLTVGNAEEGSSGFGALWGRGAVSRFDGRDGPLSLTGEVATGMVGIDWISRRWRTGLALAMSRGIGGYSAGVNSGEIESKLTGLFPWVGYDVTDRVSVWATAGYGAGVLTFTPESAEAMTAELALSMVAAGARSELLKLRQLGGVMLALETDTRLTRTTTGAIAGLEATAASVWQRRLGLEGSRAVTLGGRLSLRPSVEVGLRYDGGDAETGAGMDVGAGLGFSDSGTGLAVDVHVRTLLVHEAEGFSERGVAFSVSYDPTPSTPLGVSARVAPSWGGQAQSGVAALWGRETMAGMAHGGAAQGYRLNGEVGYGLPVAGRFVGTPRVGFARSEHSRDYRVGYGLGVLETGSLHVEVGVDALRSESPLAGGASNALRGQASLGW